MRGHLLLGLTYIHRGDRVEGIEEIRKAVALSEGGSGAEALLWYAYATSGDKDSALKVLEKLHMRSRSGYVPPTSFAVIYSGLNEKEQAFQWLEKAFQERSGLLIFLRVDPVSGNLHSDPRFADLLARLNLPSENVGYIN